MTAVMRAQTEIITTAWDPLSCCIDRLTELVGAPARPTRRSQAMWLTRAWLANTGVVSDGEVPTDVAAWMDWVGKVRSGLAATRLPWRILPLDAALDARITLQSTRGAPGGPWLPLVVGVEGDYQIYVPRSRHHGVVSCLYRDEPADPFAVIEARTLVELARSLIAAWPTAANPQPREAR